MNVQGPDGQVVSFPDGTDAATINHVMSQNFKSGSPVATPPPDKYQQAAQDEISAIKQKASSSFLPSFMRPDPSYGASQSFANGMTFGAMPTIMGVLGTPGEMIAHGTLNPSEGYAYSKAYQNAAKASGDAEQPITNAVADVAGGGLTGAGLAHAGVTAVREGAGLVGRIAGSAIDGAGQGAASGFLSGEGDNRFSGAGQGALLGAGLGAAVPAAGGIIKGVAAVPMAQVAGRFFPQEAAQTTLARAIMNSGKSVPELQGAIDNATAAGQSQFTLADALGKPGADALSNVVRSSGESGTAAADFLDARQAAQGRDVAGQLSQGLGVNSTAKQLAAALENQRDTAANADYGALRAVADVLPVWSDELQSLTSRPSVRQAINDVSNTAAERGYSVTNPFTKQADGTLALPDGTTPNFSFWDNVKRGLDKQIANDPTNRDLVATKNRLVSILDSMVPDYAAARAPFAATSKAIEAIDTGKTAARLGRPEDTIPTYQGLAPDAQAAYRTGYADPLLEQAATGNPMANKALPLANDATRQELAAMSQYQGPQTGPLPARPARVDANGMPVPAFGATPATQDQLAAALDRSNAMNATYRRARTGSQSFDNLAEGHQEGLDAGVLWEAARGNWHGVLMDAARHTANAFSGNTPAVRNYLAEMLLMRGPGADVAGAVAPRLASIQYLENLARALRASTGGALAITAGQNTSGRQR